MDAVQVQNLNAELLAPGCHAGRLTLWSEGAIDILAKQNLFTDDYRGPKQIKETKQESKKEVISNINKAKKIKQDNSSLITNQKNIGKSKKPKNN